MTLKSADFQPPPILNRNVTVLGEAGSNAELDFQQAEGMLTVRPSCPRSRWSRCAGCWLMAAVWRSKLDAWPRLMWQFVPGADTAQTASCCCMDPRALEGSLRLHGGSAGMQVAAGASLSFGDMKLTHVARAPNGNATGVSVFRILALWPTITKDAGSTVKRLQHSESAAIGSFPFTWSVTALMPLSTPAFSAFATWRCHTTYPHPPIH